MKLSIRENTEEYIFRFCIYILQNYFSYNTMETKSVYVKISEKRLGKSMEDRVIRQKNLEGVRKSESANLMSPKIGKECQKQNHSIHPLTCIIFL